MNLATKMILFGSVASDNGNTPPPPTGSVTIDIINLGGATAAAPFVSYVQPFADGDIPAGGSVTAKDSNNNSVVVQMDNVGTYPSGCVRVAVLSHSCAETFGAGGKKTYALSGSATPPNNTPAAGWGVDPAATLRANSDFKVVYGPGFDAGSSTYTTSLNAIMLAYSQAVKQAWGTNYPVGGWEISMAGPVCMEFHGWEYIKNDSTGKTHGYVRCDILVKAWSPTGPFEIEVQTDMPDIWNTVPPNSGAEQFNQLQGRFGTVVQVKNGATVIQTFGGPSDPNTVTVPNASFNTSLNTITASVNQYLPQTGAVFSSTGALPTGLNNSGIFWFSYTGGNCYLMSAQTYCSTAEHSGFGRGPAWQPNTPYSLNSEIYQNGVSYICVSPGTSAASGTGPSGQGFNIVDGTGSLRWAAMTVGFADHGSGTITASPLYCCFPTCGWNTGDALGNPLWVGTGTRPFMSVGHDLTYLTQKAFFAPLYNVNIGSVPSGQTQPTYLPTRQIGGIQWDISTPGDGAGDQRIGYLSNWAVAALFNPSDPFYTTGIVQGAKAWNIYPYSAMNDESGGNPFTANNGTNNNGVPYAGMPALIPGWSGTDRAGNVSPGIAARGAAWSRWSQAIKDTSGYNGQYYATVQAAHLPCPWQVAYLKTGRTIFLNMAIQNANTQCFMGYGTKQSIGSTTYYCMINGFQQSIQLRGWAWAWRNLVQANYVMPDNHGLHDYIRDLYNDNIAYQAGRIAGFTAAQQKYGLVSCVDPGSNPQGTIDPWMMAFMFPMTMLEVLRKGQNGTTANANWRVFGQYIAKFLGLFDASVDINVLNQIGAYVLVYGLIPNRPDQAFPNASQWWTATYNQTAQFHGTISGNQLVVDSITSGPIVVNSQAAAISGPQAQGLYINSYITNQVNGTPGGVGTYTITPGSQNYTGTIFQQGVSGSYIVGPPYLPFLYDHDAAPGQQYHVSQNFPQNSTSYPSFWIGAIFMTKEAFPNDPFAPTLYTRLVTAMAAATGISPSTAGIQWIKPSTGENYQTWGMFG